MSTPKEDLDQRIASRIKTERERRGWSLTELSARSGVSRAMIHKIEQEKSSPTAALLGKLSGAFGLTMSALIARAEIAEGRLLKKEDQPVWVDPQSGYIRRHLSPKSQIPIDLVQVQLPPGAEIPMPATAYGFIQQMVWVVKGSLVIVQGKVRYDMDAGDCLEFGPPAACRFINEDTEPCTYVVVVLHVS